MRRELEAKIRDAEFESDNDGLAEEMIGALRPVIGIGLKKEAVAIGQSKIGGKPHLPEGMEWPCEDDDTEAEENGWNYKRLSFVCQINLAECKPYDFEGLPDRGMLYLFHTTEEEFLSDEWSSLIYRDVPASELREVDYPKDLNDVEGRFNESRIVFSESYILDQDGEKFDFDDDDDGETFEGLLKEVGMHTNATMLGIPHFWDEDAYEFDGNTQVALLELDGGLIERIGDDDSMFCEGTFHLVIDKDALTAGELEKTAVIYEGGT
ncbi:MAG: DUF1963 domain-containing protein [Kofleriaceae bacterium]|nr:DUF1963 domain-containing protein [Kofleriaceae bacterium]